MTTKTKERPILFNDEMVRAILEGRKTQTRRPVKPQPIYRTDKTPTTISQYWTWKNERLCDLKLDGFLKYSPFGQPGDVLYVKEAWRPKISHSCAMDACDCDDFWVDYLADGHGEYFSGFDIPEEWSMPKAAQRGNVPNILMPRWASRITLRVKRVWVERVQEITEEEARAEGMQEMPGIQLPDDYLCTRTFIETWDSIYTAKGQGWDANPFIWCCEFEVESEE